MWIGDIFFFDTPKKLIRFLENDPIMIAEHGIKDDKFGKYNARMALLFRNDENALDMRLKIGAGIVQIGVMIT